MLEFRQQELVGQRALNVEQATPEDLPVRVGLLLERTFVGEAPLFRRTGLPLDAPLAVTGAAVLAWRAIRARRRGGLVGGEALFLAWTATFLAGTAPNLGLDWQRYYLPTVALGLVLVGVGAEALLGAARRMVRGSSRAANTRPRSEEHTSELQSHHDLVCRLLLEKKKKKKNKPNKKKTKKKSKKK